MAVPGPGSGEGLGACSLLSQTQALRKAPGYVDFPKT